MFFIPGQLVALLTFPGVICHEIAHRLFCDLTGVPVYAASYFRIWRDPAGYVIHSRTTDVKTALVISVGPLIVNTVLCALISFSAVVPIWILDVEKPSTASSLLLWCGFSIGMHAFPSNADMDGFAEVVETTRGRGWLSKLGGGLSAVFQFANAARFVWFDGIYAFVIALLLPRAFLGIWSGF